MFGYDAARLHAALNDLPSALLLVAVLFDLAAWWRTRESLAWAAIWCLWAGVVSGWGAVIAGNLAEEAIEHGDAVHDVMERHETAGLVVMGIFTALLVWKLWRRSGRTPAEEWILRGLGVIGLGGLFFLGSLGGQLVFDHAAGVSSAKMIEELRDRGAMPASPVSEPSATPGGHTHAPGTPEHDH
jgi:uncharacterized membrane protein